jgi:hypothetical protein
MKKFLILAALLILFVSSTVIAQQQANDIELGIAGSFYRSLGGDYTSADASALGKLGIYISDNLELGISPKLSWNYYSHTSSVTKTGYRTISTYPYYQSYTYQVEETVSDDNTVFGMGAFISYSFLASPKIAPYFGAQYYKSNFKNDEDKGEAGINAGIKFFISRKTAWDFGLNYLFDLNEKSQGSPDGFLLAQIGISFLF